MKKYAHPLRLFFLVVLALIAYLGLNYYNGVRQFLFFASMAAYGRLMIWISCYSLFFMLYLSVLVLMRRLAFWIFVAVSSLSVLINVVYNSIVGFGVDQDVIEWLVDQKASLPYAFSEFFGKFVAAGAFVLFLIVVLAGLRIALIRSLQPRLLGAKKTIVEFSAATAYLTIHLLFYFIRPVMLPAEVNVPLLAIADCFSSRPNPEAPASGPSENTDVDKIVLLVDESIRADYFEKVLGDSLQGLPCLDYGEAAATVPCSAGSNALLRWGIYQQKSTSKNYDPRQSVYIWSYAKRAGFKTVLIDGQHSGGSPQNFLGRKERQLIDENVELNPADPADTDVEIARVLERLFLTRSKEFIYVVKRGVHFPYQLSYPPGYLADDASRINKYEAAMRYSTGRFFSMLKDNPDFSHIFIIYTSDHGQVFEEGKSTHCRPDNPWEEYSVPLLVLTGSHDLKPELSAGIASVHNHASHEQIFPTLLWAMGYSPDSSNASSSPYASPLYARWYRYTVLLPPFVPTKGCHFEVFSHFPFRTPQD